MIDPINTVAWFAIDALWFARLPWLAYAAASVTVATGVLLVVFGRREGRGPLLADLGLNCRIAAAAWHSQDLHRVRDFRRRAPGVLSCDFADFLLR